MCAPPHLALLPARRLLPHGVTWPPACCCTSAAFPALAACRIGRGGRASVPSRHTPRKRSALGAPAPAPRQHTNIGKLWSAQLATQRGVCPRYGGLRRPGPKEGDNQMDAKASDWCCARRGPGGWDTTRPRQPGAHPPPEPPGPAALVLTCRACRLPCAGWRMPTRQRWPRREAWRWRSRKRCARVAAARRSRAPCLPPLLRAWLLKHEGGGARHKCSTLRVLPSGAVHVPCACGAQFAWFLLPSAWRHW